jgi:hypothetical protein
MNQKMSISKAAEFEKLLAAAAELMGQKLRKENATPESQSTKIEKRFSVERGSKNGNSK